MTASIKGSCSIVAQGDRCEVHSENIILRPIQSDDLSIYQEIFNNKTAMRFYLGGVRDITLRFYSWLERWKEHPFSALAIVDRISKKVIGHVISGHGDYEGNFQKGWSEMAIVLAPSFWNSEFKNEDEGIGIAGKTHLGTEAVRATVAYLKFLKTHSQGVPSDVMPEQREELELAIAQGQDLNVRRNAENQIDWIYLPLTKLKATVHRENTAQCKILHHIFLQENGGKRKTKDTARDIFTIKI